MSGRIYDSGVPYGSGLSDLPTCDKCGADMWKSAETNFYGTICIIKNCDGKAIYGKEIILGGEKYIEKEENNFQGTILKGNFSRFDEKRIK